MQRSRTGATMMLLIPFGVLVVLVTSVLRGTAPAKGGLRTNATRTPTPVLGTISEPDAVGPSAADPLAGIERDIGKSVMLGDGSTLWLFGDSARRDGSGRFDYFVIGTGAWATAEEPTRTIDYTLDGEPVELAVPTHEFPDCPESAPVPGMWPESAVVIGVGDRERVLLWLGNVCLGEGGALEPRGTAVAQWWYDPSDPPTGHPIRADVLNQRLFAASDATQPAFGRESILGEDGLVYLYGCTSDPTTRWGDRDDCYIARVAPEGVADTEMYRVWDGRGWVRDRSLAEPMHMPGSNGEPRTPPGQISVERHGPSGLYVMAYSPWPGWTDSVEVRTSQELWGPWSEPATVDLPGCRDVIDGRTYWCYTASRQPSRDAPGRLGIGYYDSALAPSDRAAGAYLVASVPFDPGR